MRRVSNIVKYVHNTVNHFFPFHQEDYPGVRPLCYAETHVFVLCFDIGNRKTFDCIPRKWIPEVRKVCPDEPIVLIGCKKGEVWYNRLYCP